MSNGCIWPRIRSNSGLLWAQQWTFGFCKRKEISWLRERLLASQGEICYKELLNEMVFHTIRFVKCKYKVGKCEVMTSFSSFWVVAILVCPCKHHSWLFFQHVLQEIWLLKLLYSIVKGRKMLHYKECFENNFLDLSKEKHNNNYNTGTFI
jgi:hypothetical protein